MDKRYDKRTRRTRRRPKSGNAHWSIQNDTKNIKLENARPWWNTCFLVGEIHLRSQQTSTINEQMLARSTSTRLDDQRKDHIDPIGLKQRNRSKQLQSHGLPSDDVENINSTNKGRDIVLANKPQTVPWGTERMLQRIKRHSRIT